MGLGEGLGEIATVGEGEGGTAAGCGEHAIKAASRMAAPEARQGAEAPLMAASGQADDFRP